MPDNPWGRRALFVASGALLCAAAGWVAGGWFAPDAARDAVAIAVAGLVGASGLGWLVCVLAWVGVLAQDRATEGGWRALLSIPILVLALMAAWLRLPGVIGN
jgi:hypothetical protein